MSQLVFAYFGPDTVMPLASIVASALGVFLMFGQTSIRLVARVFRPGSTRAVAAKTIRGPHLAARAHARGSAEAPRS